MAAPTQKNWLRARHIAVSRRVKWILLGAPGWMFRRWWLGWLWRALFLGSDGKVHRAGEILLADLREFSFAGRTVFSSDPLMMARREGRREVLLRIINYLNLDEDVVLQMMEIDDGE